MNYRRRMIAYLTGLGAAVALVAVPGVARSQSANPGASSGAAASSAGDQKVDDATLQHVAHAYVAVRHINSDTKERIARTQDNSERQQIASQAEAQKLSVVKQEGIDPQQYNKILQLVQNDPDLQQKFLSYVNAAGGV
jgi:mannitol-specific phosphotransferase system IIBC component